MVHVDTLQVDVGVQKLPNFLPIAEFGYWFCALENLISRTTSSGFVWPYQDIHFKSQVILHRINIQLVASHEGVLETSEIHGWMLGKGSPGYPMPGQPDQLRSQGAESLFGI